MTCNPSREKTGFNVRLSNATCSATARARRRSVGLSLWCYVDHTGCYVDHTGRHQLVLLAVGPTRVVTGGCQIGYVDHTGCHHMGFRLQCNVWSM
jgi:hypothetical protein